MVTVCVSGWCLKIVVLCSWYQSLLNNNSRNPFVADVFGPMWINACNDCFYINGIRWLESHVNILSDSFEGDTVGFQLLRLLSSNPGMEMRKVWLPLSWRRLEQGRVEKEVGVERGKLASKRFVCTQFCSTLLFWSVCFCPLQNESAWRFINFFKSGVKRCGTHQRGEVEQIWKGAVFHLLACVCSPHPSWSQRGLNWCPPHFSSSCYLHVTLILIHLKSEKSRARQLLSPAQSSVSRALQPHSIAVFALAWIFHTMTFLGCTV